MSKPEKRIPLDTAILLTDGYKISHVHQYPPGIEHVYSNLTARNGRDPNSKGIIFFGLQYFIKEYLLHQFRGFFENDKKFEIESYSRRIGTYLGKDAVRTEHIEALHDLGYLPLRIKSLPEGSFVPYGVPVLTVENTDPHFYWLTNAIETLLSSVIWKACTSATSAFHFRKVFNEFSRKTVGDVDPFLPWQGHDFSFRGMSGPQDATLSGAAHLLSFTGTDTIPAISFLEQYYGADADNELIGGSVPATEHSVMCAGGKQNERETFRRLICDVYPTGVVSIVSDTWNLWHVLNDILPSLRKEIMSRNGKVVIRPDSGDPSNIINGDVNAPEGTPDRIGALRILYDLFPGPNTTLGYKQLDSHVGLIYGDSITPKRQYDILDRMAFHGFASNNIVLGIGSYNYNYTTRDVHGFAMKATHVTHSELGNLPIFKCPITDDGSKKSAIGLLRVDRLCGEYTLAQDVSREEERSGELQTVFLNGKLLEEITLQDVRDRVSLEWPQ